MKKVNDSLAGILDLAPITETLIPEIVNNNLEIMKKEDSGIENANIDEDTEFARENLKVLINKGNAAIDKLLEVAKESETPRAYEVVSALIRSLAELNKDLLEVHKRKKELQPKVTKNQNINVGQAVVFTGSTKDLIKLIKQNKEE